MLGHVEIRQAADGLPRLVGSFPYGTVATIRSRGTVRKETFAPRAFRYAIESPEREINLLVGHSYQMPLASKRKGSLSIADSAEAVTVEATLPPEPEQPTWMKDALLSVTAGLMTGMSPGFQVPPKNVVPDAERLVPEDGNPGVMIREIAEAVLLEVSLVTRPQYEEATIEARAWREIMADDHNRCGAPRIWL